MIHCKLERERERDRRILDMLRLRVGKWAPTRRRGKTANEMPIVRKKAEVVRGLLRWQPILPTVL
jgi:hypothetical protein